MGLLETFAMELEPAYAFICFMTLFAIIEKRLKHIMICLKNSINYGGVSDHP